MTYKVLIKDMIDSRHVTLIKDALVALDSDPELDLEITIDSTGGLPTAAIEIYDLLEKYRSRTTTVSLNSCMSAAVIIFLAADTRLSNKNSKFMIHPTSFNIKNGFGFASALRKYEEDGNPTDDIKVTLGSISVLMGWLTTARSFVLDTELKTTAILKSRARFTDQQLTDRTMVDSYQYFTPTDAIGIKLATKII